MRSSIALLAISILLGSSEACAVHLLSRQTANPEDCLGRAVPTNRQTAIKNARIFDGKKFGTPQNVIINGNKIVAVNSVIPPGIETVDGNGKFLIPGLIDSHVHPQSCSALTDLAAYGVTTGINMNCQNYDSCAMLKGQPGVADYFTASLFAVGSGSLHAQFFGVPDNETIHPDTDLAANVKSAFDHGSAFYKVVAEDKGPSQAQQNTIVQLVHGYKNKFTATHATLLQYYDQAIKSKADTIQHTPSDGLLSAAQINLIKSQGQFVTPTLEFYRIAFGNPAITPLLGLGPTSNYSNCQTNVVNMHKAGIPIAVGTDSVGVIPGVLNYHFGRSLHCEIQNLVDAGFGTAEVLKAATAGAAKLYKLSDRGSISLGMRADLLLLNSNPVTDIKNSLDIAAAWAGGIRVASIVAKKGDSCDPLVISAP
ncbi:Fc.00g012280.m01.CDS01 [Cosmosporella sp. VM-42]